MDETNKSEVARIKQQIAIEYQAASRVFTDFNATARHAYLTARQEKLGACLEELTQHMSPEDQYCELKAKRGRGRTRKFQVWHTVRKKQKEGTF